MARETASRSAFLPARGPTLHAGRDTRRGDRRRAADLDGLFSLAPAIRLVKGAYNEPAAIAFPKKRDVDANYFQLAQRLLGEAARQRAKPVFGTHDVRLIDRIREAAVQQRVDPSAFEFHMLYGIRAAE